jgi:hypothetical protein
VLRLPELERCLLLELLETLGHQPAGRDQRGSRREAVSPLGAQPNQPRRLVARSTIRDRDCVHSVRTVD